MVARDSKHVHEVVAMYSRGGVLLAVGRLKNWQTTNGNNGSCAGSSSGTRTLSMYF